jgi:hypothetical protein
MTIPHQPTGYAARRHEIPTHLDVEDRLLLGLPARRALALLAGLAFAYSLWHQWPGAPEALRAGLAGACVLVAATAAFVRPGGRGLEAWALLALRYAACRRASVWRSDAPAATALRTDAPNPAAPGWEELAPRLDWARDPRGAEDPARRAAARRLEAQPWAS